MSPELVTDMLKLLRAERMSAVQLSQHLGMQDNTVHRWMREWEAQGLVTVQPMPRPAGAKTGVAPRGYTLARAFGGLIDADHPHPSQN